MGKPNFARSAGHAAITRRGVIRATAKTAALIAGLGLMGAATANSAAAKIRASFDVDAIVQGMTRRQKIEQMLMPDFRQWTSAAGNAADLTVMNDEVASIIDRYDFGGVILFANNVKQTDQTLRLTMDIQSAALRNTANEPYGDIPMLITIDQEGGIVYRLGSGTALPGNMAIGAARDTEQARRCGAVIGSELDALKINVDFAPVLDTNNNPNNPVIGLRSISSRPDLVARLGVPLMEAIQTEHVAAAAKHFPGHGDAGTDSHTGLPRIEKTKKQLEELEFIPFRAAIERGVDMVMTAHIQYPLVETGTAISTKDGSVINLPATLSRIFLTDILRDEMGFEGVSVTDALNMGAIADNFDAIDAVRRTFMAGVDIALMPVSLRCSDDVDSRLEPMIAALEADAELSDERLNVSVRRILSLKKKRGILDYAETVLPYERELAAAKKIVGSAQHRAIEREVSDRAVTVVRNERAVLPMRLGSGDHLLLIAAYGNEKPGMELSVRRAQERGIIPAGVSFESLSYADDYASAHDALADIRKRIVGATHVIVISEIGTTANLDPEKEDGYSAYVPTQTVRAANDAGRPVAVLSISKPYDVAVYDEAPAVVAVYGNAGMDPTEALAPATAFGPNVPAGVEVILGAHAAMGKLPVDTYAIKRQPNGSIIIDTDQIRYAFGTGIEYDPLPAGGVVDKTALSQLIARIERDIVPNRILFTQLSYAALERSLAIARRVRDDDTATQEQIDAALAELRASEEGLIRAPHRSDGPDGSRIPGTGDARRIAALAAAITGVAATALGAIGVHADEGPDGRAE